jgi:hypothetical protein
MLKQPKENLLSWVGTANTSLSNLNTISKVLAGGIAILLMLVLWLTYQVFTPLDRVDLLVDPRSLIVQQVTDVSELATAIFETEIVIPVSEKGIVLESKLLYIAHGTVRVGVDLSEFKDDDVQIEENKITVTLPPLKVLDSKLDLNHSKVYTYDRGFLGWGPDVVKLQEQAQRDALMRVEEASCQNWLIKSASDRVQQTVERLLNLVLSSKGYKITVRTQIPPDGSCTNHVTANSAVLR